MESNHENRVFHGSKDEFDIAHPRKNTRIRTTLDGERNVIFEGISFHATPYKWIALAYTYHSKTFEVDGKKYMYTMGVSLYQNDSEIEIYGVESLEKSLEELYGNGGYVYHFSKDEFIYTDGLGDLEVISQVDAKPIEIERIDNPVEELKKLGVTFKFIDLSLPENNEIRESFVGKGE